MGGGFVFSSAFGISARGFIGYLVYLGGRVEIQREMLQALLMDRFQLRFHRETRQGPVYLLTLGKGALKLNEVKDKGEFEWVGGLKGGGINCDGMAGKNISMPVLAHGGDETQRDVQSCIFTSLEGWG